MERPDDVELAEVLREVRRIAVQSRRLVNGVMAGSYRSVFRGSGIEFKEVREYVPGDDPRSVDWNVTARLGRPHVKTHVDERELTVLFLLDLSASMSGGAGHWSARQMAARVCACLALSAVQNDDKVGLIAFSRSVDRFVPPRQGNRHAVRIVRDCLALPGRSARTDLGPALAFAAGAVRRRAIVFLLSDFLATGCRPALSRCARRHDVIAVRLLGPELAPPPGGLVRVRDPESGREQVIDWSNPRLHAAHARAAQAWRTRTESALRRAGVDRMDVPVPREHDPSAVVRPILELFRMRELRGSRQ